jgi:hypothetical protein
MHTLLTYHFNTQTDKVVKVIDSIFTNKKFPLLTKDITRNLLKDRKFLAFHEYYLGITNKPKKALNDKYFFSNFKTQYSLQGIDKEFLETLENNKTRILQTIVTNPEAIYSKYFQNAKLTHKGITVHKDLGSFVAKLSHTFCPSKFAALDNPIRKLLGLKNEGFYFSFLVVNRAYANWLNKNKMKMAQIKLGITLVDTGNQLQLDSLTDLKILDTFLWQLANKRKESLTPLVF